MPSRFNLSPLCQLAVGSTGRICAITGDEGFAQRLREMGINTTMVHHDAPSPVLLDAKMPYYVENMVNRGLCLKWNSKVRDWDKFVTGWAKGGRPESAQKPI